jgi:hypothetical protein
MSDTSVDVDRRRQLQAELDRIAEQEKTQAEERRRQNRPTAKQSLTRR